MSKFVDLTGKRFGRLLVVNRASNTPTGSARWNCVCDCGKHTVTTTQHLNSGKSKSCGCLGREHAHAALTKHGETDTRLHHHWEQMRRRCRGGDAHHKKYYADRGITVCNEWNDYTKFRDWSLANGYKEGLQIDRIDNDKGYSPENCRWVTFKQNIRNRRVTKYVTYEGEKISLPELCEKLNLEYKFVWGRLSKGWTLEEAVKYPKGSIRHTKKGKNNGNLQILR